MMMIVGPECHSRRGHVRLISPNRHEFGDIEIERHGVAPVSRLDMLLGLFNTPISQKKAAFLQGWFATLAETPGKVSKSTYCGHRCCVSCTLSLPLHVYVCIVTQDFMCIMIQGGKDA